VNKAELIQALSAYYDGSKSEAAKALNAVVETITYKTAAGEKVSITGFGVFEKVHRSARMVRNPRTGERKRAKATAVPRFRAGSDLKAYVSGAKKVPKATAKKAAAKTSAASKAAVAARKAVAKPAAKKATTAKKTVGRR
jgi:DNA-binding protein HU-beta